MGRFFLWRPSPIPPLAFSSRTMTQVWRAFPRSFSAAFTPLKPATRFPPPLIAASAARLGGAFRPFMTVPSLRASFPPLPPCRRCSWACLTFACLPPRLSPPPLTPLRLHVGVSSLSLIPRPSGFPVLRSEYRFTFPFWPAVCGASLASTPFLPTAFACFPAPPRAGPIGIERYPYELSLWPCPTPSPVSAREVGVGMARSQP